MHDGTRLIRADRYDHLKEKYGYSDEQLNNDFNVWRIHPDFYIVATAAPPPKASSGKSNKKQWLTPEMLTLFFYHKLPQISMEEETQIVKAFVSNANILANGSVINFTFNLCVNKC